MWFESGLTEQVLTGLLWLRPDPLRPGVAGGNRPLQGW